MFCCEVTSPLLSEISFMRVDVCVLAILEPILHIAGFGRYHVCLSAQDVSIFLRDDSVRSYRNCLERNNRIMNRRLRPHTDPLLSVSLSLFLSLSLSRSPSLSLFFSVFFFALALCVCLIRCARCLACMCVVSHQMREMFGMYVCGVSSDARGVWHGLHAAAQRPAAHP